MAGRRLGARVRALLCVPSAVALAACTRTSGPGEVSAERSSFTVTPAEGVVANGLASVHAVVTVRDGRGAPVAGARVVLTATGSDNVWLQPAASDGLGQAAGALASLRAETKTLQARIERDGRAVVLAGRPTVRFIGDAATLDGIRSTALAAPDSGLPADGVTQATVRVRVVDRLGNPVPGVPVVLSASGEGVALVQPPPTDADGLALGAIAATRVGSKAVTATVGQGAGVVTLAQQPVVEFVSAGPPSAVRSEVTATPALVFADGSSAALVAVVVRDADGEPVAGVPVELAASGSQIHLVQPGPSDAQGRAWGSIASTRAEEKVVTVTARPPAGAPVVLAQQPRVTFVAHPGLLSPTLSSLTATPGFGVAADGASTVQVAVVLRDVHGNPIVGASPVVAASGLQNVLTQPPPTGTDGSTACTLATLRGESKTLRAHLDVGGTQHVLAQTPTVRFTWPQPSTFYVRASGSDAAAGTSPATAWRTLGRATAAVGPGAVVWVGAGTYAERVEILANGTADARIRFLADPDGAHTGDAGQVVVDAGGADAGFAIGGSHVDVEGFTIRGAAAAPGDGVRIEGAGVHVRDCRVWGCTRGVSVLGEAAWFHSAWGYRRRVTFGTAHSLLHRGFTVAVTMDTRVASTRVALASGDDLRVVWQPASGAPVELDRIGDTFDAAATRIEFRLQSDLPAGAGEDADGAYFVYYGNAAAGTPPRDEGGVYWFADSFGRANGTTIGNGWVEWNGGGEMELAGGALVIKPTGDANPPQVGAERAFALGALPSDFRVTFTWSMPPNDESMWSFWGMNVGHGAAMHGGSRTVGVGPALYHTEGLGTTGSEVIDNDMSGSLETGITGTHAFRADVQLGSRTFDYWRGGVLRASAVPWVNTVASLDACRIGADNFSYQAGQEHTIDDLRIVLVAADDPETALAPEQARADVPGADAVVEGCVISANGIGVVVQAADRTVVRGNLVYGNAGEGLAVAASATAVQVAGNTFDRNVGSHVHVDGSGCAVTLRDNLATFGAGAGFAVDAGTSTVSSDHNGVFGNAVGWSGLSQGANDVAADPLYVDPDGPDDVLGGSGGADDRYEVSTAPPSPALDVGEAAAWTATWADGSSFAERTTRLDEALDGTAPDGATTNLGFHARAPSESLPPRAGARAAWTEGESAQVATSSLGASGWSGPGLARPARGPARWLRASASPAADSEELVGVLAEVAGGCVLDLLRHDGTAWRRDLREDAVTGPATRAFDVVHEASSGDGLVVWVTGSGEARWRARHAGRWSDVDSVFATPPGMAFEWLQLVPRPGSDRVACLLADTAGALHAIEWDGSAWDEAGSAATLTTSLAAVGATRCFDGAYASASGDLLVAWGEATATEMLGHAVLAAAGGWSIGALVPATARARVVRMAAEPGTDRIAIALAESGGEGDVAAVVWDGGTFAAAYEIAQTSVTDAQEIAVAWTAAGAVVAYRDGAGNGSLDQARWTSAMGWTSPPAASLPGVGVPVATWLREPSAGGPLDALVLDDAGSLWAVRHENGTWTVEHGGAALGAGIVSAGRIVLW